MRNILRRAERGSVLFIILIAVALFAALGYAVSNMMQSGSSGVNISDEKGSVFASEILDYARNVRQAIQVMRISNGCRDTEISFENPIEAGYVNGTNTACQVFHPDGGGMSYISPLNDYLDNRLFASSGYGEFFFTGSSRVTLVGSGTATNADMELTLILPYIRKNICDQINDTLDMANAANEPPVENADAWHSSFEKFTGTYGGTNNRILGDGGAPVGMSGCREGSAHPAADTYFFYQVLIAR